MGTRSPGEEQAIARVRLLAAVAVAGAGSLIVEVSAVRLLAPAFGASLETWTNVIAVVLAALALGSWWGGRAGSRTGLAAPFTVAAALLLPVPWVAVPVGTWLLPAPEAFSALEASGHLVRGSLASALLLVAAPMVVLGATGPLAVRALMAGGLAGGGAAGRVLAWSTLGGLAGSYLPSHLLYGAVGVRGAVLAAASLLALAAILVAPRPSARWSAVLVLAAAAGSIPAVTGAPIRPPLGDLGPAGSEVEVVEEIESPYQYVRVARWRVRGAAGSAPEEQLRLSLDEGVLEYHSLAVEGRIVTGGYYDYYALLPAMLGDRGGRPVDVAVVGGGAGTMTRMLRALHGDGVGRIASLEIDPEVAAQSRRFGFSDGASDRIVVGDGRAALRQVDHRFDVVMLDAYARQVAIPSHLATLEWFREVESRLAPGGIFAMNVSTPGLESPIFRALVRTLREVFPGVAASGVPGSWNVLLLAAREKERTFRPGKVPAELEPARGRFLRGLIPCEGTLEGLLLTDDQAPLEPLARRR